MIYNFIFRVIKYYRLLLLFSFLAIIILAVLEKTMAFLLTYIITLIISLIIISLFKERNTFKILFLTIFSISTIFTSLVFIEYKYSVGNLYMGEDDKVFDTESRMIASKYDFNLFEAKSFFNGMGSSDASKWYTSFVIQIYGILELFSFEYHTMVPRLLNSFFLGFAGIIIYLIGSSIGLRFENRITSALLSGLWPVILWHSAAVRRDTIILLSIMGLIYGMVKILKKTPHLLQNTILSLFSFCIVFALRPSFAIVLMAFFCFYYVISQVKSLSVRLLFASMLLVLAAYPVLLVFRMFSKEYMNLLEVLLGYGVLRLSEEGQGLSRIIFSQPLILQVPLKLIYASILPLPIPDFGILTKNIRWIGTFFWLINLPFIFNAIKHNFRFSNEYRFMVMIFMLLFIVINLSTFTETHQMLYYPLGIIIIFYQREELGPLLSKYKSLYNLQVGSVMFIGALTYIFLKIIL